MSQNERTSRLERAFNPRVVAIVGDKKAGNYSWLSNYRDFRGRDGAGKVYSVQIDPNEIPGIQELGVENYPSLLDVPEPIDYAVCAVPRAVAPRVVKDAISKGVGALTLFTSGFAETGTEDGIRLQAELVELARSSGLVLIGPNCMGIYNPKLGMRTNAEQDGMEAGPAGFLSQSGTHNLTFSVVGAANGIHVSKSVSFGNAIALDAGDFLEYFRDDRETQVVGMYIEGVRDGRRFFHVLREVAARKPVVIWKGGQTADSARATASHTASLAESMPIWEAAKRQVGALTAHNIDEMVDMVKGLLWIRPGSGYRCGIVSMTGGNSVLIADSFARAGLRVLDLSPASYDRLQSFFNIIGGSYRNPLDAGGTLRSLDRLAEMLDIMHEDPVVDCVVLELPALHLARRLRTDPDSEERIIETVTGFRDRCRKPFVVIHAVSRPEDRRHDLMQRLAARRVPVYETYVRGATALKQVVDHHRFREEAGLPALAELGSA